MGLPFCGAGSPVYSCSTIGLAHSCNFLMFSLGLPFCGAGSPVYGCSTIGLAHSRNLLVSALRITFSNLLRAVCATCVTPSHYYSQTRGPGCALKTLCMRGKNHTRREILSSRLACCADESKTRTVHQPGAAPPSSSTGRQLNYWQTPHLVRRPAKSV